MKFLFTEEQINILEKNIIIESDLKIGSKGPEVERLQRALGIKVDGDFGPDTKKAVIRYQKKNGIKQTGVVGPRTYSKLFGKSRVKGSSSSEQENIVAKHANDKVFLFLDGKRQKLYMYERGKLVKTYDVSTGATGFGTQYGSGKTPSGMLSVKSKAGGNLPDYALMVNLKGVRNKKTGEIVTLPICDSLTAKIRRGLLKIKQFVIPGNLSSEQEAIVNCEAHVLTRALVLDPSRGIYIHGTNYENSLGTPRSSGCIRVSNSAVKELYNKVPIGTKIFIQP